MEAVLRLDKVTRIYNEAHGKQVRVLEDASFSIGAGEIVSLVAPSGAGKSTLLHLAGLLERPGSGEIYINGKATVKLAAGDNRIVAVGEGNGPVNALDNALRSALTGLYPELTQFQLVDYKVRILEGVRGTGAVTRTLVGSSDGTRRWDTVGVHENVIAASWMALEDAVAYGLLGAEQD